MDKTEIVIDTNVAVVANGKSQQASPQCVAHCVTSLRRIRENCCVLLDGGNAILNEYRRHLSHSGQPGPGDAFFKWLFENQANPEHSRGIALQVHPDRGFDVFPDDRDLDSFDSNDRKFVALALASGTGAKILNASDTDWWLHRQGLQRYGVEVVFLCPELMQERR